MPRKTLADVIAEQNQMAKPKSAPEGTVLVRVLVAGRYNGTGHKTLGDCAEGAIVAVAGGWYAARLIADGLVERYVEPEQVPEVVEAVEPAAKPTRKRRGARS